jgi:hypothetical protein
MANHYIPRAPKKRLGPSIPFDDPRGCVKAEDGVTESNETRSWSITAGAKNANRDKRMAVKERMGARYKVTAFESPAIIAIGLCSE